MRSLLKANVNEILQKAEDPKLVWDNLIKTMQEDLEEARVGVEAAIRHERKLRNQYDYYRQQARVRRELQETSGTARSLAADRTFDLLTE